MKRKHQCFIALGGLLMIWATTYVGALVQGRLPAKATVSVISHAHDAGEMLVAVVTTNTGRIPLVFCGQPPFAPVRAGTPHGWTNFPQRYVSNNASFGVLLPGKTLTARYTIPPDTTLVQVGCSFETAGARSSIAASILENGWWNRFQPIWSVVLKLVPDGRREEVEFWSSETKITPLAP